MVTRLFLALYLMTHGSVPMVDAGTAAKPPRVGGTMTPAVRTLVDRVQAVYEKTQDFKASFRQDYLYKAFKRVQTSTGTVTYRKPALMRWEYETPSPKTFVQQTLSPFGIDECQLAPALFTALKLRVQAFKKTGQFVLSGSVRFTSRKAIRESLTGRIFNLELLPLTISEANRLPLFDLI